MKHIFLTIFSLLFFAQANMAQSFDHKHLVWDSLLKKYVNGSGLVNYKGFKKDEDSLNQYLQSLSQVTEENYSQFSKNQKLAFLINAYNAFTIRLILDHYPIKSIGDIGSPISLLNLARGTPWKKEFFILLGKTRNLDWIEHQKLRKDFTEPRIHFAIVCASLGCPILKMDSYKDTILESQLLSAKLGFLKDTSKNSYDKDKNILRLSKIFDWFKEDFVKQDTLIHFVQEGFSDPIKADTLIEYNDYSWKLNEQK
ncbi:MAG: DUF547 domain-containing protein [Leptospira sp.]|nr:DUF547 domain-containing protein [Leptospira sp.]